MKKYNDGTVITNSDCIACNKCVAHCPIMGANVSVGDDLNRKILVDGRKCTHCGQCISVCAHHARVYRDDTDALFEDLRDGVKLSVIVDSSFFLFYGEKASQILGFLSSLGVEHVYDTSFGAEISIWAHGKYIKDNQDKPASERAFIINSCPSVVSTIELYHPLLIKKIIPVYSSVACTAIYARKYLKDNNPFVYLGPCLSQKDEFSAMEEDINVVYYVTYEHLTDRLKERALEQYERESDIAGVGIGELTCLPGVFAEGLSLFFKISSKYELFTDMSPETFSRLEMVCKPGYEVMQPLAAEVNACKSGCLEGPGISKEDYNAIEIHNRFAKARVKAYDANAALTDRDAIWEVVNNISTGVNKLDYEDFTRTYADRYRQPFKIPASTYDEIFDSMLKDTEIKRNINCGSCGYESCAEMVKAIAYGYNRRENCIHYMNDMMTQKYTYNPITGLYNAEVFHKKSVEILRNNPDRKYFICAGNVNKLRIINDIYGYEVGNTILNVIGTQLKSAALPDGICGYVGGGNFVLFMEYKPGTLERIQSIENFDMSELDIHQMVTMRFGIYIIEKNKDYNPTAMLNYAFMAARGNSSAAQNTFTFFASEAKDRLSKETEIITKLQRAFDNDELSIVYMPQIDISTRAIVGAEGRCHWVDGDGVFHPHEEYVSIAEKNGMIRKLDHIIWTKAFATVRRWLDTGVDSPQIDLFMSMESLMAEDTFEIISRLRDEYKISNHHIRFEITERAQGYDSKLLAKRVRYMRKTGFKIAICDFGAGIASLSTLLEGTVDTIRINMDIYKGEGGESRGGMILASIARMTKDLGVTIEADNVENEAQAGFLMSVGIPIAQGPLFSQVLTEHEYLKMLKTTKKKAVAEKIKTIGKIDAARFYNSSSNESTLFESYFGPAVIAEFDEKENRMDVARINSNGMKFFGCEGKSAAEFQALFSDYINGTGVAQREKIRGILGSDEELVMTFPIHEQVNFSEIWVKCYVKELSRTDYRHMLFLRLEDISSEQVVEDALDLSNKQMSFFMNSPVCGNCIIHARLSENRLSDNLRITMIDVNKAFCELLGYTKAEIMGWTEIELRDAIHPMDRQYFFDSIRSVFADDKNACLLEFRAQNKAGYYKPVKYVMASKQIEDGSFMAYVNLVSAEENR